MPSVSNDVEKSITLMEKLQHFIPGHNVNLQLSDNEN